MNLTAAARRLAVISVFGAFAAAPCRADSFTSSASSAGSASVGSVSDSFRGSSRSASGGDKRLADGDYRIIEIAEVADRVGMTRVTLQALAPQAASEAVRLDLPTATFAKQALAHGDVISATQRVYGYEFARGDTHVAFFLVLNDDWRADLDPKPVSL